ncbi:Putative plasmid partition protein (plasmid) [Borrelia hermsii YBT]|uniref:Putative plasmid partition protein n=1 Tax=Borrelia hermsii YBT TaxID=1313295 RepID=W5T1R4_BORHE|nr:Putative plasmid partition protein [Borrelia hermsii YBT]
MIIGNPDDCVNGGVYMKIELKKRVLVNEEDPDEQKLLSTNEEKLLHYNALKSRLKANFRKEIFHKIDSIRILKEIKDNDYYKLEGYKSFDSFIKSYRLAKAKSMFI